LQSTIRAHAAWRWQPRRGREHAEGRVAVRFAVWGRGHEGLSTGCPIRRGSTPGTARTPRSAPSGRTWRSGANGAG